MQQPIFKKIGIPKEEYLDKEYYIDSIGNYRYVKDNTNHSETYDDYDIHGNLIHKKIISDGFIYEAWYGYDENHNQTLFINNAGAKIIREFDDNHRIIKEKDFMMKYKRTYRYDDDTLVIKTYYKDNFYIGNYIKEIRYTKLGYSIYVDKRHRRWVKIHRDKGRIVLYEDSSGKYYRIIDESNYKDINGKLVKSDDIYEYMELLEIFKNKWFRNKKIK